MEKTLNAIPILHLLSQSMPSTDAVLPVKEILRVKRSPKSDVVSVYVIIRGIHQLCLYEDPVSSEPPSQQEKVELTSSSTLRLGSRHNPIMPGDNVGLPETGLSSIAPERACSCADFSFRDSQNKIQAFRLQIQSSSTFRDGMCILRFCARGSFLWKNENRDKIPFAVCLSFCICCSKVVPD